MDLRLSPINVIHKSCHQNNNNKHTKPKHFKLIASLLEQGKRSLLNVCAKRWRQSEEVCFDVTAKRKQLCFISLAIAKYNVKITAFSTTTKTCLALVSFHEVRGELIQTMKFLSFARHAPVRNIDVRGGHMYFETKLCSTRLQSQFSSSSNGGAPTAIKETLFCCFKLYTTATAMFL